MHRSTFIALLSSATFFATGAAAAPADPATGVLDLVQRHVAAQAAFDVAALTALTASNYVEVSPLGEVDARAKMLAFYAPENKRPAPVVTVEEPVTRLFGTSAVVIAKLRFAMTGPDGQSRSMAMRASYLAVYDGAMWKLASAQYTGIAAPRAK